jgi:hypothetical protein
LFRARFSDTRASSGADGQFKFLRVIYIGVDNLVNSEQRETHTNMDAIYLTILLVLLLATIGLVLGLERIGEDR